MGMYLRCKNAHTSFVDHETKFAINPGKIAFLEANPGRLTATRLRGGGVIKATKAEVEAAKKNGTLQVGTGFGAKTKIIMRDAPEGSHASKYGMKIPVEIPREDDEDEDTSAEGDESEEDENQDEQSGENPADEDDGDGAEGVEEGGLEAALKAADQPAPLTKAQRKAAAKAAKAQK